MITSPHDRPDPAELLEAVRAFLLEDVSAATSGQIAFHARVAANVVALVERQLACEADHVSAHATRLAELGCDDDAEVAARIRNGELDDRYADVAHLLRAAVWDKLQVVNPKYAGEHASAEARERS